MGLAALTGPSSCALNLTTLALTGSPAAEHPGHTVALLSLSELNIGHSAATDKKLLCKDQGRSVLGAGLRYLDLSQTSIIGYSPALGAAVPTGLHNLKMGHSRCDDGACHWLAEHMFQLQQAQRSKIEGTWPTLGPSTIGTGPFRFEGHV